ncbi:MAG: hypothetical protein SFU56_03520 [Capsulimonadales bacterium]|nr:hypothetical protein [Capsulimonadales bacterium]
MMYGNPFSHHLSNLQEVKLKQTYLKHCVADFVAGDGMVRISPTFFAKLPAFLYLGSMGVGLIDLVLQMTPGESVSELTLHIILERLQVSTPHSGIQSYYDYAENNNFPVSREAATSMFLLTAFGLLLWVTKGVLLLTFLRSFVQVDQRGISYLSLPAQWLPNRAVVMPVFLPWEDIADFRIALLRWKAGYRFTIVDKNNRVIGQGLVVCSTEQIVAFRNQVNEYLAHRNTTGAVLTV